VVTKLADGVEACEPSAYILENSQDFYTDWCAPQPAPPASPPPSGPGFVYFSVNVADPSNVLVNGQYAELVVLSDFSSDANPPGQCPAAANGLCWRATLYNSGSQCGDLDAADSIYHSMLGCQYFGTGSNYPFEDASASWSEGMPRGNFVKDSSPFFFRLALSGAEDGYSGMGVDLFANANQQDLAFVRPSGQDVHIALDLTIGSAPTFAGASVSVASSTVPLVEV
jgi:hypothetical protein